MEQISSESTAKVSQLLDQALLNLQHERATDALNLLIEAKKYRIPVRDLDHARAIAFVKLQRIGEARESLKEELRYFPDNGDALDLLKQVEQFEFKASDSPYDDEFRYILSVVRPYTMMPEVRMFSLYRLARTVCEEDIPGNFVECGVAAGGSSAMLAYVIKRFSKRPRKLFSFDSFEGMPEPTEFDSHAGQGADETGWGTGTCAAPEESLMEACGKFDAQNLVQPVKGYFEQTLPVWRDRVGEIALLHLDGDWYESTKAILINLYDKVVERALLQVDDYGHWDGCKRAIHEFERERKLRFKLHPVDAGVWFRKTKPPVLNMAGLNPDMVAEFQSGDPHLHGFTGGLNDNERFQLHYALLTSRGSVAQPGRFAVIAREPATAIIQIYAIMQSVLGEACGAALSLEERHQFSALSQHLGEKLRPLVGSSLEALRTLNRESAGELNTIFLEVFGTVEEILPQLIVAYDSLAPGGLLVVKNFLPPLTAHNTNAALANYRGAIPELREAFSQVFNTTRSFQQLSLPILFPEIEVNERQESPPIPGVHSTLVALIKT